MNIKQSVLTAAVAAGLAFGSGPAAAYIYADSGLTINNLTIAITGATVTVNRFDFTLTNTASLNNVSAIQTATCGGTPASNTCGTSPALDALAVNAPGSTVVTRTNNSTTGGNFTSYGPLGGLGATTGNWSNSDTVITTAELVNLGSPTNTNQIAESLITTASSAAASSQITSITGFVLTFTVGAGGTLDLNFSADPDLMAAIQGQATGTYSAQSNINAEFRLTSNSGLGSVTWAPAGTAANDCSTTGGFTGACTEIADSQNLNTSVGTTVNNTTAPFSFDPNVITATPFGIHITGLQAGTWTLTLNAVTSTALAFTPIPEPGVLGLLGIGLLGLFATTRRKSLS